MISQGTGPQETFLKLWMNKKAYSSWQHIKGNHMCNSILCKDDRSIFFLNWGWLQCFRGIVILMDWVLFKGIHPLNSPALLLLKLFPFRVEHPYSIGHTTCEGPLKSGSFCIPRKSPLQFRSQFIFWQDSTNDRQEEPRSSSELNHWQYEIETSNKFTKLTPWTDLQSQEKLRITKLRTKIIKYTKGSCVIKSLDWSNWASKWINTSF